MSEYLYPTFEKFVSRKEKEKLLKQRARALWLTGLSGSGKSTIAQYIERKLHEEGFITAVLDGDNIRTGICKNLGFSEQDRMENIRRAAEVCRLFLNNGIITICSFVSPQAAMRQLAKEIIGTEDFMEIYVNAPLEVCAKRDVKGLYKKALSGKVSDFTGIHQAYEPPLQPALEIRTDTQSIEQAVEAIYRLLKPAITHTTE